MNEWTTKTLQHGNAVIIIHRPMLADTERAKREQKVKDTLNNTMRDYLKRKEA